MGYFKSLELKHKPVREVSEALEEYIYSYTAVQYKDALLVNVHFVLLSIYVLLHDRNEIGLFTAFV